MSVDDDVYPPKPNLLEPNAGIQNSEVNPLGLESYTNPLNGQYRARLLRRAPCTEVD